MCSEVTVKVWGIHAVSPEEEKERLRWEGFACIVNASENIR